MSYVNIMINLLKNFETRKIVTICTVSLVILFACQSNSTIAQDAGTSGNNSSQNNVLFEQVLTGKCSVQLYLAPCEAYGCPIQLRLLKKDRLLDVTKLGWEASSRELHEELWTSVWQDQNNPRLTMLTLGEEYNAVSTAIEIFTLGGNRQAILIRQSAGFENIKRRYDMYMVENDKLVMLWSDIEGEGPYYSDLIYGGMKEDGNQWLYVKGLAASSTNEFDNFRVTRLVWSEKSNLLQLIPVNEQPAVQIGSEYKSVSEARSAALQWADCFNYYWIVKSDIIDELPKGKAVIISLTADQVGVKQLLTHIRKCNPNLKYSLRIVNILQQE